MGKGLHRHIVPLLLCLGIATSLLAAIITSNIIHVAYTLLFGASLSSSLLYRKQIDRFTGVIGKIVGSSIRVEEPKELKRTIEKLELYKRKGEALIPEIIDGAVEGSQGRAYAFNRIVEGTIKQLGCESAEIALIDKTDGHYHSSIVIGRPFRVSIDEYLANPSIPNQQPTYLEPILFAGSVLGALRIGFRLGQEITEDNKKILKAFALQASVAIVNADFLAEILKMREASHASLRVRTGFLANLSHELRGPLGIVLNATELMKEGICGPITSEQSETLTMIQKNGGYLLELLNDVLDFARIESGKVTPQPVSMPSQELLADISSVVRAQADAKHHRIIVEEGDEALHILCDRRHIRQIMINFLTNAIKYTPEGGEIRLKAESMRGGRVKISVRDTGVGIARSDREKVFAAFERIDTPYSRKQIGTGLGMPLTRKLAEINHGTVDFESTPKEGSTFWVTIPAAQEASEDKNEAMSEEAIFGAARQILFISALHEERSIITRYLAERGFLVLEANGIEDALRVMQGRKFSAVLVDDSALLDYAQSPIGNLRDEMIGLATPIILMSGEAFSFNVEDHLRAGVDRHISKPATLQEISRVCLELSKSEERLLMHNKKPDSGPIVH